MKAGKESGKENRTKAAFNTKVMKKKVLAVKRAEKGTKAAKNKCFIVGSDDEEEEEDQLRSDEEEEAMLTA